MPACAIHSPKAMQGKIAKGEFLEMPNRLKMKKTSILLLIFFMFFSQHLSAQNYITALDVLREFCDTGKHYSM